jgi:UMF1 family MFS transporter
MLHQARFWLNRSIVGWILYDVASSGYILLIPGVAYAVYFRQVVCGAAPGCDALWGMLVALALGIAGVLSPLLGAIADLGAIRHRLFVATTLLCCTATLGLYWVQPGAMVLGGLCFVLAQVGYMLSAGLYDSYLPRLVDQRHMGRLSGWGWGLGYLGGIFCFLVTMPLINPGLEPEHLALFRLTFLVVGGFYLVMALPALLWLPRHSSQPVKGDQLGPLIQQAYGQVLTTLKSWRQNANTFRFLAGYYLISDVIVTLNSFIGIYFSVIFGLSIAHILRLSLLFNLVSIGATVGFGYLSDRTASKRLLQLMIVIWVGLLVVMGFSTHPQTPMLVAVLTGLVVGPTQSLCRGWFASMILAEQSGEMFGFHALVSRVSAILGPLMFGLISSATGSQRLAVLSLLLLIAGGSLVLSGVRFSR